MVIELTLPLVQLFELCERAAQFRRAQVTNPHVSVVELRENITYSLPRRNLRVEADGWVQISFIADRYVGADLPIYWHPETDRVRVQRPPVIVSREPYIPAPLQQVERFGVGQPFKAKPGYIYSYDGVDYDAAGAEWLTAENGSMDGWTWRKRVLCKL